MKKRYFSPFLLCFSILSVCNFSFAQDRLEDLQYGSAIKNYLATNSAKYRLNSVDVKDLIVSSSTDTNKSNLEIAYVNQAYEGIKIYNAVSTFAVKNNEVVHHADRFVNNLVAKVNTIVPSLNAEEAIKSVASEFRVGAPAGLKKLSNKGNFYSFADASIAQDDITAELVFVNTDGGLRLAWNVELYTLDSQNLYSARVDAVTGKVIEHNNLVISCNFSDPHHTHSSHNHNVAATEVKQESNNFTLFNNESFLPSEEDSKYNVFAIPVESPSHGERSIVQDPAYKPVSPEGWLNNGQSKTTKGNNVNAYEDRNNRNRPGGQPTANDLNFDFPLDLSRAPRVNEDAAITNLFYLSNIVHDVYYVYGFDEKSGNFQEDNFGKGGAGSDSVNCEAQDGSGTNNANFMTRNDGQNGRMQMYNWDGRGGQQDRDGDFDNGIIAHEYGHGISIRLTGGRNQSGCLGNQEQMGEGWSDWFGLMLTIERGDKAEDKRGVGTYALYQQTNGSGIRKYPYSKDMGINPFTYSDVAGSEQRVPHGVGSVWATVLWDLSWAYIEKYGYDPDLYEGKGGNNKVMQVVMDGLKLQPCSPGFVDGRDAILKADRELTGGEDQCLIWEVFARRGLGFKASQGSSRSKTDQREDMSMPPEDDPTLENCTGLDAIEFLASDYKVFPNPTNNVLSIRVKRNAGEANASLVDINGRVVLSQKVNLSVATDAKLDMSGLAAGVYILNIKGESINTFDKVIKK